MSNGKMMNELMGWLYYNGAKLYKEYGQGDRINAPARDIDKIRTEWLKTTGYSMNKEDFMFSNKLIKGLLCDNIKIEKYYEFLSTYTFCYDRRFLR